MKNSTGQLFVVATPIGNLEDMTFRAIKTLQKVAKIAAEDTRTSRVLLRHFKINTPMIACHEHNEKEVADTILELLNQGQDIALISDAGTPLINDPGFRLVQHISQAGVRIVPLPGACSPMVALCAAGLASDRFSYLGFFPRSGRAKTEALRFIEGQRHTLIFLESPKRIVKTLKTLEPLCINRDLCVARELTKLYEEFIRGSCETLLAHFAAHAPRGEMVLLIGPCNTPMVVDDAMIFRVAATPLMLALAPSAKAREVAKVLDVARARVYDVLMAKDGQGVDP
ncbi:MAG: 16S rRNA (cytidine(1402)-2'-O)-methyltransferase [Mariprofundaceae bacterium]|nr:16S rRNA (cytidine(1402)-2'-O)-methyltransferase [Mariprofundaceae bacterium]